MVEGYKELMDRKKNILNGKIQEKPKSKNVKNWKKLVKVYDLRSKKSHAIVEGLKLLKEGKSAGDAILKLKEAGLIK